LAKDDFVRVSNLNIDWDPIGAVPQRYLNPSSFRSYLSLLATTTSICQFFQLIGSVSDDAPVDDEDDNPYDKLDGYKVSTAFETDPTPGEAPTDASVEQFLKRKGTKDSWTELIKSLLVHARGALWTGLPGFVVNPSDNTFSGYIRSGEIGSITAHGKYFAFDPRLALPNMTLVGDVLGRHFTSLLGDSIELQFDTLEELKAGLGNLRLTEVGDELTHLYKCIDIALSAHCGLVPVFSGSFYEGCVLSGGLGSIFYLRGQRVEFEDVALLQATILTSSTHGQALSAIAALFPIDLKASVLAVTSMVQLRSLCVASPFTEDQKEEIIARASLLRFSQSMWPLSPAMLKRALSLMSDITKLDSTYPISRLCLFSADVVLIGLSVFGEKSAPSWNLPQGTSCKLGKSPPSIPTNVNKGSSNRGTVSDATWVMTIRRTDLKSAVSDFRLMAKQDCYRSVASSAAKKQGFLTFSRDRMGEFWNSMVAAYRVVNPDSLVDQVVANLEAAQKRPADSGDGNSKPARRMRF
jgi:hypothetical protein